MDQKDQNRPQSNPAGERGREDQQIRPNTSEDVKREGNIGSDKNRNQPDLDKRPGGERENLNR